MNIIKKIRLSNIIYRLISVILFFNIINLITSDSNPLDISFMQNLNIISILFRIMVIFLFFSIASLFFKNKPFDYLTTIILLFICSIFWLDDNNIFFIIILFLLFLLLHHFKPDNLNINFKEKKKIYIIVIIICGLLMFFGIAILGILRYKTFGAPNFDLGIPGQNFYYLKKTGIPFSTCERNSLVSHFSIHISPIYYLILPIYYIFSHVLTLQIISAILISSCIIPIYLLCKRYKLPPLIRVISCLIFCVYAPAICSTYFDFHENIFLTPLLLWLFYFYTKDCSIGVFVFSILVLLVKEDAPLYLVIFSIFMIFDKKKHYGVPVLILSVLYFITVSYILKTYGSGVMYDRYGNLIYDNSGIIGIIKTILVNPAYFLKQLMITNENNFNKIKYILELLLPLGFIPLCSKEKKNYILLIPLLFTIMTTYQYSYDINFHYSCGIVAFLFYLFIKNIKDIKNNNYLFICLIIGALIYRAYAFPYMYNGINNYKNDKNELIKVEKLLKEIPKEASVNASAFILPHLVNRDIIYEVYYHDDVPDVDYVVLDTRGNDYIDHYNNYINNGYTKYNEIKGRVIILKK